MTGAVSRVAAGRDDALPPLAAARRRPRPPGPRPHLPGPDDGGEGVFGPGSVSWRVHADPLIGIAGLRALHLRALAPGGTAGLLDHGSFDPWGGLARMMRQIGVITFGSTVESLMAAARIRALLAAMDREEGEAAAAGTLLWGHACQVSSFLEVTRRGGLRLSPAEQDGYVREQVRFAALLGLEPEDVPASRGELERYVRAARPSLTASPAARAFAGGVVAPHVPEAMALLDRDRPAWAAVAGLAFATLPSWARRLYDMPYRTGPAALAPAATTVALHALRDQLRS